MTVAENIKRSTKALTANRAVAACKNAVKIETLMGSWPIFSHEYQFIDGSKLICRVYW